MPVAKVGLAYVRPGADFSAYKRVQLLPTYVAFRKDWRREFPQVSSGSVEAMKRKLATGFNEIFGEVLAQGGYPVVTEPGPDVLLMRAALINLYVTAPDTVTAGRGTTYGYSAGEMTLVAEFFDSESGEILARVADRRAGSTRGWPKALTSVENWSEARRMIRDWAGLLCERLDAIHAHGAATP